MRSPFIALISLAVLAIAPPALAAPSVSWMLLAPDDSTAAGARSGHAMVFDPRRDRVLAIGARGWPDDVWVLDLRPNARWRRGAIAAAGPSMRSLLTAVVDSTNDRVLVFGGGAGEGSTLYSREVWQLSLAEPMAWTRLDPEGVPPDPTQAHGAVFDANRRRMLVFGGQASADSFHVRSENAVWALECGDTLRWRRLEPVGGPPAGRFGASLVLDAAGDRALVFGGFETANYTYMNDTWVLSLSDPPTWTQLGALGTAPSGRYFHSAAFDAVRRRMLVFGGKAFNQERPGDTFALSLAGTPTWSLLEAGSTPTTLFSAGLVVDPVGDRLIRYGGNGGQLYSTSATASLAEFGLATNGPWAVLPTPDSPAGPTPRYLATLLVDPVRDELVVEDAAEVSTLAPPAEHWVMPLASPLTPWGRRPVVTPLGPYLNSIPVVLDPIRRRQIRVRCASDMLQMSLDAPGTWNLLAVSGTAPPLRYEHDVSYDAAGDRLIVSGGWFDDPRGHSRHFFSDVWALSLTDPPTWTPLRGDTDVWTHRTGGVLFDATSRRLLRLGTRWIPGTGASTGLFSFAVDSVGAEWRFDEPTPSDFVWQTIAADPIGRRFVSLDLMARRAWYRALDDPAGWLTLDLAAGAPSARYFPGVAWDAARHRVLVMGGVATAPDGASSAPDAELWALNLLDPVAAEAALISADATPSRVRLRWWTNAPGANASLERAAREGAWEAIATLAADGTGEIIYDDADVSPGAHYGYRLAWPDGRRSADAWVDVPTGARLALAGARPNPSRGAPLVAFELPGGAGPATLELLDVAGRRVVVREVGLLGAGAHVVSLAGDAPLAAGVYFARLRAAGDVRLARVAVVR